MTKLSIATIILTYNEELHIKRCLENAKKFSQQIFIIDSFSTDKTLEIAKQEGAFVLQNKWENSYAKQFNWALKNCPIKTKWILRLDADEYLYDDTINELNEKLKDLPLNITSLSMELDCIWLNKKMKFGTGKVILKRIFRTGSGKCEERLMDEHIETSGDNLQLSGKFVDENLNNLSWWAHKHVNYAVREAADLLNIEFGILPLCNNDLALNEEAKNKRNKKRIYAKLPLFWRAFAYFIYRYFFRHDRAHRLPLLQHP